jgi:hypothetical protein
MAADHTKGRLHLLLARLDSIDARMLQLRDLTSADAGARLLRVHAGISLDGFRGMPLAVRRALVSACYQVTVLPATRGGPGFWTRDVRLVPREEAAARGPGGQQAEAHQGAERGGLDDGQVPS